MSERCRQAKEIVLLSRNDGNQVLKSSFQDNPHIRNQSQKFVLLGYICERFFLKNIFCKKTLSYSKKFHSTHKKSPVKLTGIPVRPYLALFLVILNLDF